MYKVPQITQDEACMLFMRRLDPRIREQMDYHVEGDLDRVMAIAEKVNVWRAQASGNKKGQKHQKFRSLG